MPPTRIALVTVFALRIAYGAALIAAPERVTRRWLGAGAGQAGGRVAVRGLGAREVLLHSGAINAAVRGAPLLPWVGASVGGDVSDIAATVGARDGLPAGSAPATLAVAGASALLTVVAAAVDHRAR